MGMATYAAITLIDHERQPKRVERSGLQFGRDIAEMHQLDAQPMRSCGK